MTSTMRNVERQGLLLGLVCSASALAGSAFNISVGVALPLWQQKFHMDAFAIGILPTVFLLSNAIGNLLGGQVAARIGNRIMFQHMVLVLAVGNIVVLCAGNQFVLCIGLIIGGLSVGLETPAVLATISECVATERRGRVISIVDGMGLTGLVIPQGIAFLSSGVGEASITIVFAANAIIGILVWLIRNYHQGFIAMMASMKEGSQNNQNNSGLSRVEHVSVGLLTGMTSHHLWYPTVLLTCFLLFWMIPANTWGAFLNYYFITIGGRSQSFATSNAFIANIIGVLFVFLIYRRFVDTKYRYIMMYTGLAMCTIALAVNAIFGGQWQVFTACYYVYCAFNMIHGNPIYRVWSQQIMPTAYKALIVGATTFIVQVSAALFGLVTPLLMQNLPELLLWFLVSCLIICGVFAGAMMRYIQRKRISDPVFTAQLV